MMKNEDTYELLWMRHGLSEGNVDLSAYEAGDPNVELNPVGWQQAVRLGEFLRGELKDQEEPALLVCGEFLRHRQTLAGIRYGMGAVFFDAKVKVHYDTRLNEQSFGVLPHMAGKEGDFEKLSLEYSRKAREGNHFSAAPLHGESIRAAHDYTKSFIDGTLQRDMQEGHKKILLVTSGRVIQTALMSWFHLPMKELEEGRLKNPDNCDVIKIAGNSKNWTATKIYDGPSAMPCDVDFIKGIKPISIPDIPDFIRLDPEFLHLNAHEIESEIPALE